MRVALAVHCLLLSIPAAAIGANEESLAVIQARYGTRHNVYYDAGANQIYWYHSLKGDCDQNGVVNISDITRLAGHLGKTIDAGNIHTAAAAADCDENRQVNISDLSAMGAHLDEQLTGYNVYWEYDFAPGYPLHSDEVSDDLPWRTIVDYEFDAVGNPAVDHLRYNIDVGAENAEKMWFWCQEELAGPVGRLSKMRMAYDGPNTSIMTYAPFTWGLNYDPSTMTLSFFRPVRGDTDATHTINLSDITPVGQFFGQDGPWQLGDREWEIDCNLDDSIDFADLFIVNEFLNQQVTGFNVYYLPSGGDPLPHSDAGILIGQPTGSIPGERYRSTITLSGAQANPDNVVWVRPVAFNGELGARSEVITIP